MELSHSISVKDFLIQILNVLDRFFVPISPNHKIRGLNLILGLARSSPSIYNYGMSRISFKSEGRNDQETGKQETIHPGRQDHMAITLCGI